MVTYRDAGVDIEAGAQAVSLMKEFVKGIGSFGGMFDTSTFKDMEAPVLVASIDSVGTKTEIASALGQYDTLGYDIVHHCVNDILVQGARPLFFLDYIAVNQLKSEIVASLVSGCAVACKALGCELLGGETAEMPDVYAPGAFDLVGTIVGVVDRSAIIDGRSIAIGDIIIGMGSSGLHTNGYSLARLVLRDKNWQSMGETLLIPHRSYLTEVQKLQRHGLEIKGLAHITGGGLMNNLPRILPQGVAAHIRRESWPIPYIFEFIQRIGRIDEAEMMHVFNMGLGMLLVTSKEQVNLALSLLDPQAWVVGEIISSDDKPYVEIV